MHREAKARGYKVGLVAKRILEGVRKRERGMIESGWNRKREMGRSEIEGGRELQLVANPAAAAQVILGIFLLFLFLSLFY